MNLDTNTVLQIASIILIAPFIALALTYIAGVTIAVYTNDEVWIPFPILAITTLALIGLGLLFFIR